MFIHVCKAILYKDDSKDFFLKKYVWKHSYLVFFFIFLFVFFCFYSRKKTLTRLRFFVNDVSHIVIGNPLPLRKKKKQHKALLILMVSGQQHKTMAIAVATAPVTMKILQTQASTYKVLFSEIKWPSWEAISCSRARVPAFRGYRARQWFQ